MLWVLIRNMFYELADKSLFLLWMFTFCSILLLARYRRQAYLNGFTLTRIKTQERRKKRKTQTKFNNISVLK